MLIASVLGVGLTLGSPSLRALAADTNITGGATVTQDVQGQENEATNVTVDQGSTWKGSANGVAVNDMLINVSDNSKWEGSQKIHLGYGDAKITDSTWIGNSTVEGDPNGGWTQSSVELNHSTWKGNVSSKYGSTQTRLLNGSTYEGAISVESGDANFYGEANSSIKGNVIVRGNQNYRGSFNAQLNDSHWVGDGDVQDGYFSVNLENNATGVGNVKAINGEVNIYGYEDSSWKGNLSSEATVESQSSRVSVGMHNFSSYEGDVSVTSAPNSYGDARVSLGQGSTWKGNLTTRANGGNMSSNVDMYDHSSWVGNADVDRYFYAYMGSNSSWNGSA